MNVKFITLASIVNSFNTDAQTLDYLIEELSELITAIQHHKRGKASNCQEEMGHAILMIAAAMEKLNIQQFTVEHFADDAVRKMLVKRGVNLNKIKTDSLYGKFGGDNNGI